MFLQLQQLLLAAAAAAVFTYFHPNCAQKLGTGEQGPVHTSWGSAHSVAARGATPARFSSQTLLSLSPRIMAEGDAAETTRWRFPGGPCHHRAQGGPFNPFGGSSPSL